MQDSELDQRYFLSFLAAFVRGNLASAVHDNITPRLFEKPIHELTGSQKVELYRIGIEAGLRLHKFKRTMNKFVNLFALTEKPHGP